MRDIKYPIKAISYCASNCGNSDRKHSFEFWVRGHLIRVIGDKPFSRGDMIWIDEIKYDWSDNTYYIMTRVIDDEPYESNLPVLSIAVSRMIYSVTDFKIKEEGNIKVLEHMYIKTDDSYSLAFISLVSGEARINCKSESTNASFNMDFILKWNQ